MLFNSLLYIILLISPSSEGYRNTDVSFLQSLKVHQIISQDSLKLHPNEGLVYHKDNVFTGTSVFFDENETKRISIDYLQGKKHGIYKKWFENGRLSFEAQFSQGKQHGLTQTWWRNGQLRSKSQYQEGMAHGVQLQWYKSGAKFKRQNLVKGQEQGLQQSWRENGKLYNNYEAKNGRIFGLKRANLCYELENEYIQTQN